MSKMRVARFFLGLSLISSLVSPALAQDAIGQAVWIKGNVKAISIDKIARALQRRSPVYEKDAIETDATGSGQITFTDGTLLSLRSNTNVVLSKYQHGASTPPEEDSFVVDVVKGGFRTVTGVISKSNPKGYQVTTPIGTIGVHGTVYDLFYNLATSKLSVGISEGSITINTPKAAPVVLTQGTKNIAAIVSAKGIDVMRVRPADIQSMPRLVPAPSPSAVSAPAPTPRGTPGKNQIEVSPCP